MRYFVMKYDPDLTYSISLKNFDLNGKHRTYYKEQEKELKDTSILYTLGKADAVYPDFIENPVFMASKKVSGVLNMYEETIIFKEIRLINKEEKVHKMYYHLLTEHINGLSNERYKFRGRKAENIVLDYKAVKDYRVFQLKDHFENNLFLRLDVVESLLRRKVAGVKFIEVGII